MPHPAPKPYIQLNMVRSHLKNAIICIWDALLARHGVTRHKVNYVSNYIIIGTLCCIPSWHDLDGLIYLFTWYRNVLRHTSGSNILLPGPSCVFVTKIQLGFSTFFFQQNASQTNSKINESPSVSWECLWSQQTCRSANTTVVVCS